MIYEYYLRQIYKTLRRNYKMDMDKIIKFIFYMRQNYKGNSQGKTNTVYRDKYGQRTGISITQKTGNSSSTTYKDKYGRIQKRGNSQRK